jgi:hypothetical protein
MVCECCKTPIIEGERILMFASRPWLPHHLSRYKKHRIQMRSTT